MGITRKFVYVDHYAGWRGGENLPWKFISTSKLTQGYVVQNSHYLWKPKNIKLKIYFKVVSGVSYFQAHGRNKTNILCRHPPSNICTMKHRRILPDRPNSKNTQAIKTPWGILKKKKTHKRIRPRMTLDIIIISHT